VILGIVVDRGPRPDAIEDETTLLAGLANQWVDTLLADKGYESERFHSVCRDDLGIRSIIPTSDRGRPRHDGQRLPAGGRYRRLMQTRFPNDLYGQRWQIETVFSMLKRNLGSSLRARRYHTQTRELRARVLTHNLMILWPIGMFHTEQHHGSLLWGSFLRSTVRVSGTEVGLVPGCMFQPLLRCRITCTRTRTGRNQRVWEMNMNTAG